MTTTFINLTDLTENDPFTNTGPLEDYAAEGLLATDPIMAGDATVELNPLGGATLVAPSTVLDPAAALITFLPAGATSGSGQFPAFLRIQAATVEDGFNSNNPAATLDDKSSIQLTHSLPLSSLGTTGPGNAYYEFTLDIAQSGQGAISLDELKIYTSNNIAVAADFVLGSTQVGTAGNGFISGDHLQGTVADGTVFNLAYDMGSNVLLMTAHKGNGHDDYLIMVPKADFNQGDAYVTLFAKFGGVTGFIANSSFEEFGALTTNGTVVGGQGTFSIAKDYGLTAGGPYNDTGDVSKVGETVYYQITVTNTGTDALTYSSLTDSTFTDSGTLTAAAGTNIANPLAVGASWVFTTSHVITQADLDGTGPGSFFVGFIDNTATATLNDGPTPIGPESADAFTPVSHPSISIEKLVSVDGGTNWYFLSDDSADTVANISTATGILAANLHIGAPTTLGTSALYEFLVTNTGNVDLSNVTVTDSPVLPGGTITVGALAAGASVVTTSAAAPTGTAGDNPDTATAAGSYTDGTGATDSPHASDSADFIVATPSIDVEKLVSVDGGTNWYFLSDDSADTVANISTATGILAANLHIGAPTTLGTSALYEFLVTNTGNVDLSNVTVTDSPVLPGGTITVGALAAGHSVITTAAAAPTGTAGDNPDTATASGSYTDSTNTTASPHASDSADFIVATPSIDVEKLVSVDGGLTWYFNSTLDSETATQIHNLIYNGGAGPNLTINSGTPTSLGLAGDSLVYDLLVINTGNVDLSGVTITDSPVLPGGTITVGSLAAGATYLSGPVTGAAWGANANTDTATTSGSFTDSAGVVATPSASDNAHYFGAAPSIEIEKLVSVDGGLTWYFNSTLDSETASQIHDLIFNGGAGPNLTINSGTPTSLGLAGDSLVYDLLVINTGNVDLSGVTITDSPVLPGGTITVGSLAAGATYLSGPATGAAWAANTNTDTATTSGSFTDSAGVVATPSASDNAHYLGATPSIEIEKLVSVDGGLTWYFNSPDGETATQIHDLIYNGGAGPNLTISAGTPHTLSTTDIRYDFLVVNTGNVDLSNVMVTDSPVLPGGTITIGTLAAGHAYYTGAVTGAAWALGSQTDTATTTGHYQDSAGVTADPSGTDQATYVGVVPKAEVEKLVSVDNGAHWYFSADDATDSISYINAEIFNATGHTLNLVAGTPVAAPGATVEFMVVVTNLSGSGSGLSEAISVTDSATGSPLDGLHFTFGGTHANTTNPLAPGQSAVSNLLTTAAVSGLNMTDTANLTGTATDAFNHTALVTDSDQASYTGFSEGVAGLTIGYWYNHWSATKGNNNPFAAQFEVTGPTGTTGKGLWIGTGPNALWLSDTQAHALINSSQSANDARQILLSQAIAAQLNVDNGDKGPAGLINDAVAWLTGTQVDLLGNPVTYGDHSSGNIDFNGNHYLDTSGGTGVQDWNASKNAFTFEGPAGHYTFNVNGVSLSSSSNAWGTLEAIYRAADYAPTTSPPAPATAPYSVASVSTTNTPFAADGEGLKNALQAFNQNELVTNAAGAFVAWDQSGSTSGPFTDISINGSNDFWNILHIEVHNPANSGLLHGIY